MESMMVLNYTLAIYVECEYCLFSTKKQKKCECEYFNVVKFDWRFRMILRLYIEIGWAVSQLVGVN